MVWFVRNIYLRYKGVSIQLAKAHCQEVLPTSLPTPILLLFTFGDLNLFHPGFLAASIRGYFFSTLHDRNENSQDILMLLAQEVSSPCLPTYMVTEGNTDLGKQSPCQSHWLASSKTNTRTKWNLHDFLFFPQVFFSLWTFLAFTIMVIASQI